VVAFAGFRWCSKIAFIAEHGLHYAQIEICVKRRLFFSAQKKAHIAVGSFH